MEIIITCLLMIIIGLILYIGKRSIATAREHSLFDDSIVVSKSFFESACRVSELMNNSPSLDYKRKNLPSALADLEREVMSINKKSASSDLSKNRVNVI